jgi:hypothetical protein
LLVVLALLVLVPAIVLFTWWSGSSREAEAELARVSAAGEPTTPDELESFYPIAPAEREAARMWLIAVGPLVTEEFYAAAGQLPIVGSGEAEIPPPGQPWPDLQAAEKLLEQYADSLRRLHEAAESGRPARYPADFALGVNMTLDYIQPLRTGARLLALEAHVRAHQGDARGAARSIYATFMLADSLKQEQILIAQLVRYAIDGMARKVLQRQLPAVDFSDEDLDRLQAHLRAVDYSDGVQRAMMGERVMGIAAINNPAADPSGELAAAAWGPFRNANLATYLKYMSRIIAATKRPLPQARQETERIDGDIQAAVSGGSGLSSPGHIMTALLISGLGGVMDAATRGNASNRATDAVIAVERFRSENARLPKRLQELVPDYLPQVPVDPFDGQPLRYVVRGDEYIIYSVGRDGIDDGGQGDETCEPDLLFPVQLRQSEP